MTAPPPDGPGAGPGTDDPAPDRSRADGESGGEARRAVSLAVFREKGRRAGSLPAAGHAPTSSASDPSRAPTAEILTVRRPPDDEDLPGVWGLPAGSLRPGEGWEEAVVRAGREKLGVRLEPVLLLNEGSADRAAYRLHMRLYRARILEGEPAVPQPVEGVTQYTAWRWAPPDRLREAADRGSLCSRLCLEAVDREAGG